MMPKQSLFWYNTKQKILFFTLFSKISKSCQQLIDLLSTIKLIAYNNDNRFIHFSHLFLEKSEYSMIVASKMWIFSGFFSLLFVLWTKQNSTKRWLSFFIIVWHFIDQQLIDDRLINSKNSC